MIRVLRFFRKFPVYRQLHTFKSRELDIPDYHKKPLDPHIISLVKKYDADIFYSSHIELNKKPLTYTQRKDLMLKLGEEELRRLVKKSIESERSLIIEKLVDFTKPKQSNDTVNESSERPLASANDSEIVENKDEKSELAKSKLKILTEMNFRRSALEYELQSYPDNWMEDYETFDESELSPDTQYGTPG